MVFFEDPAPNPAMERDDEERNFVVMVCDDNDDDCGRNGAGWVMKEDASVQRRVSGARIILLILKAG